MVAKTFFIRNLHKSRIILLVPKLYIVNLWQCQRPDNFGLGSKTYLQQSFLCTNRAFKTLIKNCPVVVVIVIAPHKVNVR